MPYRRVLHPDVVLEVGTRVCKVVLLVLLLLLMLLLLMLLLLLLQLVLLQKRALVSSKVVKC